MLPARMGPWISGAADDVVIAPDALSDSVYQSLAAKRYSAPGVPPITLVVAYGAAQSYETQLHRPEICYPASGFWIEAQGADDLRLPPGPLPASVLRARRGDRADTVLYWSRIGTSHPQGLWPQRFAIMRSALSQGGADGVLVRISRTSVRADQDRIALSNFARTMWAALAEPERALLFGQFSASRPGV